MSAPTPATSPADDYAERARAFDLAGKAEIEDALKGHTTDGTGTVGAILFLDVRTNAEVEAKTGGDFRHGLLPPGCVHMHVPCSSADEAASETVASQVCAIFPAATTAAVVVYCRTGRRADATARLLREKGGYSTVLNAGGYDDLMAMGPFRGRE